MLFIFFTGGLIIMNRLILLKWRNKRMTVDRDKICYIESYNRHLTVHTANQTAEVVGKLSDIMSQLSDDFICIHKSFVANMKYIIRIDENGVTMASGEILPVSVRRRSQVISSFDIYCENNLSAGEKK